MAVTHDFILNDVHLTLPDALATPGILQKLRDGHYEADEAKAVSRCVQPGFRVLDIGAGMGYVSVLAAQRTGPENVLAVEANPDLLPVIEANLVANDAGGASVLHGAVSGPAEDGATAPLHLAAGFTASSMRGTGTGPTVEVPLIPIRDLLEAQRPHVVFMDIEGGEADLFGHPWKCPLRYFVVELHPKKYHARVIQKIVDFMSAMDMTYDPVVSRGKVLGFKKIWGDEA